MNIISNLSIEWRLAIRNRWTYVLMVLLLLVAFWSYSSPYGFVIQRTQTLEQIKKGYSEQGFEQFIREEQGAAYDRELFYVFHPSAGPNYIMSVFAVIVPLLIAIWSAALVGGEFSWSTAKIRAVHYGWQKTIITKLIVIVIAGLIIAIAASVIGIIGGHISWSLINHSPKIAKIAKLVGEPNVINQFWKQLLVLSLGIIFYGFLGAFLSLITRNAIAGAVSGFSLPFIESYHRISWLPHATYSSLMAENFTYFSGGIVRINSMPSSAPWLSWFMEFGWILSLAIIMLLISRWQEV